MMKNKAEQYFEESDKVKYYKTQILDHNKNEWTIIELSDLPDILQDYAKQEMELPIQLLEMAVCPHCDGSGIIPETVIRTGHRQISETEFEPYPIEEVEPTQCQWCAERDMINQKFKDDGRPKNI